MDVLMRVAASTMRMGFTFDIRRHNHQLAVPYPTLGDDVIGEMLNILGAAFQH